MSTEKMNDHDQEEFVLPEWMNGEFFDTVMKSARPSEFKQVIDFKVVPATAKNDHYGSVMFRASVKYSSTRSISQQQISMIVKIEPEEEGKQKEMLTESPIFGIEIQMYRDVLPKFREMLKSIGDNTKLSADLLYFSHSPRTILVLEDITPLGFTSVGTRWCTVAESEMALQTLAKWHACSYMLNAETNGSLEAFNIGVFNQFCVGDNPMFAKGTERVRDIAKKLPNLQKYVEKLDKVKDLVYPQAQKIYELCKKKIHINVLTHGDFHCKNLMFRFHPDTKLAKEVMLIDFQVSIWTSMALDLLYFMYMMIECENRAAHQDRLIYEFFQRFLETLRALGYKGKLPTFRELQIDMLHVSCIEIYLATTFLPWMVALFQNVEIDDIMTNEELQLTFFNSEKYLGQIEPILERFMHKGFFDSVLEDAKDESLY